jgi:hypothetical protein
MINYFDSISEIANRIFNNLINGTSIDINMLGADPFTAAIIQFVIVTAISYIIAPKPKTPSPRGSPQDEVRGTTVSKDSNNNPIPIVYGKRQVGLTRVFVESSGTDNQYLYVAGILCEGGGSGITAIDEVYVDDKLVTFDGSLTDGTLRAVSSSDTNFYKNSESLISIQPFFGLDNQSASSLLDETTNWTSDHKLSGLAYVALRFKWNQDAFNGLPEVRITLRGKKIYDPRLDTTKGGSGSHRQDDPTTWAYSANSSLILLDYLRNTRYGKGIPNDAFETNYDAFKTSANTCDTQVTPYTGASTTLNGSINNSVTSIVLTSATSFPTSGTILIDSEKITYTGKSTNTLTGCVRGALSTTATSHTNTTAVNEVITTINLFETNAVLDSEKKVLENVRELLVPMRGIFNYTQGKYKIIIEGSGASQLLLTKDNVVSEVKLQGESKSEKYNRVIGTYTNPDKDYQSDTVSYPPFDDAHLASGDRHATMLTEDNETLLERTVDMIQVTSPYQAEEICENILKRSRNNIKAEVTATAEALNLSIGDIVTATYDTAGFSAKPFRVMSLSINADSTVNLGLEEHQDEFYDYENKLEAPAIADTVLPNPFSVTAPVSVTLSDQLIEYSDGVVITALDVTIGASLDNFVDYYQVEYKLSTETNFIIHGQGTGLTQRILNVKDGFLYNVRVKAVNTLGVSSTYTSASRTIVGGIAPPADVEDFSCNIIGSDAHLSWTQIADLDLAFYQIRFSTLTSGASWANSVSLVEKVARPATSITVPARVGSYLIKAFDKFGNASPNETIIATNISTIGNFNSVATQTESPTFSGTLTNTIVSDGTLRLDSSELFDSATGNFDSGTSFFDSGLTSFDLYSSGNYVFSSPIDIGAVYTSRVTASITQTSDNLDDLFDARTGDFDDASSSFDGDTPANCNAHIEIALSNDNITYTSFRNFVVGDYTARYYKFRVVLTSFDLASTPVISALSVSIDMPDRIFSGNDIVSGSGTFNVVFTNPFFSANYAVGITGQGMATGDFFLLTNKTINGFSVAFKNSSNTGISKTFDFLAKGH